MLLYVKPRFVEIQQLLFSASMAIAISTPAPNQSSSLKGYDSAFWDINRNRSSYESSPLSTSLTNEHATLTLTCAARQDQVGLQPAKHQTCKDIRTTRNCNV